MSRTFILKIASHKAYAFVGPDNGEPDVFGGTRTYVVEASEDAIHSVTLRVPGKQPVVTSQPGRVVTVDNTVFFIGHAWRNIPAVSEAARELLALLHKKLPQPAVAL